MGDETDAGEKAVTDREKLNLEIEKHAHARWWQEDNLVNHRLTWLLQSQALIFAGFGLLVSRTKQDVVDAARSELLVQVLPWIGWISSIAVAIGIVAAAMAQQALRRFYWRTHGLSLGVTPLTARGGRVPSYLLPVLFAGGWGFILDKVIGAVLLVAATAVLLALAHELFSSESHSDRRRS